MYDQYTTSQIKLYEKMTPQVIEERFDFGLDKDQEERAEVLHNNSPVVSFHEHPIVHPLDQSIEDEYLSRGRPIIGYEGLKAGGLNAVFSGLHAYCRVGQRRPWGWYDLVWALGMFHTDTLKQKDGKFFIGQFSSDIMRAFEADKIVIIPTSECALNLVGNELDNLDVLYGLGLRCLGLTYFWTNQLGGGETDQFAHLTYLGIDAIHRMNDLGMMIDLNHTNRFTTLEAIEVSEKPCVFSHALASEVNGLSFPTSKSNEEIKALSEKGGLIGVHVGSPQVKQRQTVTIEDALDHIDYIVNLVGVESVAIGPDTTWEYPETVKGYRNPSQFFNITRGLVSRGYSDDDIKKIIGGNVIRVMAEIEE